MLLCCGQFLDLPTRLSSLSLSLFLFPFPLRFEILDTGRFLHAIPLLNLSQGSILFIYNTKALFFKWNSEMYEMWKQRKSFRKLGKRNEKQKKITETFAKYLFPRIHIRNSRKVTWWILLLPYDIMFSRAIVDKSHCNNEIYERKETHQFLTSGNSDQKPIDEFSSRCAVRLFFPKNATNCVTAAIKRTVSSCLRDDFPTTGIRDAPERTCKREN